MSRRLAKERSFLLISFYKMHFLSGIC
uniref:Uncharacterized protein n=1 Tax=Arundo donax TaxID=35708 RepID=A0A0A9E3W9_ARUDO